MLGNGYVFHSLDNYEDWNDRSPAGFMSAILGILQAIILLRAKALSTLIHMHRLWSTLYIIQIDHRIYDSLV